MTAAEPTDYPKAWRPREARERDEQRTEFELFASALSDDEWADFSHRVRGGQN